VQALNGIGFIGEVTILRYEDTLGGGVTTAAACGGDSDGLAFGAGLFVVGGYWHGLASVVTLIF